MCNQQNYPFFRDMLKGGMTLIDTAYNIELRTRQVFIDQSHWNAEAHKFNLQQFNKTELCRVWNSETPAPIKLILTCLWGGMKVDEINVMLAEKQFERKCCLIQEAVQYLSSLQDVEQFIEKFVGKFCEILQSSKFKIKELGVTYLSKIAFFYYWSHPNQSEFVPMIIDTHICDSYNADIISGKSLKARWNKYASNGDCFRQHKDYISYFYDAVKSLRQETRFKELTITILGNRLWIKDPLYPGIDPRKEARRIIKKQK